MSLKVSNIIRKLIFTGSLLGAVSAQAQQDSLFLSVEQLFESGIKSSLLLQSDSLKERIAHERKLYAKTGLLPDLEIGLKGGIIGQPVVFQNGLSNPTYPDTPDWSQNYTVDFNQPLYQGGKIRRSIQKADIKLGNRNSQTAADDESGRHQIGITQPVPDAFHLIQTASCTYP